MYTYKTNRKSGNLWLLDTFIYKKNTKLIMTALEKVWLVIGSPWLWTLATAVTTILAFADMGVHFHKGWQEGEIILQQAKMH